MKLVLGLNLWICLCSLIGLGYGVKVFFKRSKALYLKMITFGVACIMYSRLFQVIYLITQGNLNRGFHVGIFGIVVSFMFFFSANYGQMDGLVDDRTDKFKATRIYATLYHSMFGNRWSFISLTSDIKGKWSSVCFFK